MARHQSTAEPAFDRLRESSQQFNIKLVEIARDVASNPEGSES